MTPQEFIHKWRDVVLKVRSFYQEPFIDLCHQVGCPAPVAFGPAGEKFTCEASAGRDFAAVWNAGFFMERAKDQSEKA